MKRRHHMTDISERLRSLNNHSGTTTRAAADHIDALESSIKALVEALECIDNDLESRNFLENSSLRDTTRAALAAVKETT
jgi:hypothetical protein